MRRVFEHRFSFLVLQAHILVSVGRPLCWVFEVFGLQKPGEIPILSRGVYLFAVLTGTNTPCVIKLNRLCGLLPLHS